MNSQTLTCDYCKTTFERSVGKINRDKKQNTQNTFCSQICSAKYRTQLATVILHCSYCDKEFSRTKGFLKKVQNGRYFCSSSCAATYNNKMFPKRKPTKPCKTCKKPTPNHKVSYCKPCHERQSLASKTLGELSNKKLIHRTVRDHARRSVAHREQKCVVTGYDKHVEACHIIPLEKFAMHTPIKIINDPKNIVLLSPNVHWEFDHGMMNDIPFDPEFTEYKKELIEKQYITD